MFIYLFINYLHFITYKCVYMHLRTFKSNYECVKKDSVCSTYMNDIYISLVCWVKLTANIKSSIFACSIVKVNDISYISCGTLHLYCTIFALIILFGIAFQVFKQTLLN